MSQEKNIHIQKKLDDIKIIIKGHNAKFVCGMVGIPYQTLNNWLHGRHEPADETMLDKIIYYLENSYEILRRNAEKTENTRDARDGKKT